MTRSWAKRGLIILAAGACFLAAAGPAAALVRFDFEQRYLVIPHRYVKDRCFVKQGDEWHCFMIIGNDSALGWRVPGNEVTFAHASTRDFRHWTMHPNVLHAGTGSWDSRNIWAPHIIPWGDGYRMYYTGVDGTVTQTMGMAESPDLFDWQTCSANPLHHPDTTWSNWQPGQWANCRDPYVFRSGDSLFALNTASTNSGRGAVDLASSMDGVSWTDQAPLFVNNADSVLESLQLVEHAGEWYLFFSEQNVYGFTYLRAPSWRGPWNKKTLLWVAMGQAVELFGDRPGALISRHDGYEVGDRSRYVMKVDSVWWDGTGRPRVGQDSTLWEDWSPLRLDDPDPGFRETGAEIFATDQAFEWQPTFGENPTARGELIPVGAFGNSWIGTREKFKGPLTGTMAGDTVGDVAVGGIRSRDFVVTGNAISLRVGGTDDPEHIYVALCDAVTHEIIHSETGDGSEALRLRVWQMGFLEGRRVYVKIIDASPTGHINVDEIVETSQEVAAADRPGPSGLVSAFPNPFGGSVMLSLGVERAGRLTVDVYNVAGRLAARLYGGRAERGYLQVPWSGLDRRGRRIPAGVYFVRVEAGGVVRSLKLIKLN
jgi:hypothetical protein